MSKLKIVHTLVKKPGKLIRILGDKRLFNWLPDKLYLKLVYRGETGKKLNIDNPQTFNEKLQWIKLYDRKPEYSNYVDKYEVRKHITNTIGGEYLIPIIGVFESVNEVPWERLPNQFVLKCTHGSHCNIICEDKSRLDIMESKRKLYKWMNKSWYWFGREWPYKNIKPRIICEKYMVDESGVELKDYKFFCFNGEPKIIQVISERKNGQYYINHFDLEWNRVEIRRKNHKENKTLFSKKPNELEKMITISKELCKSMLFARIDLYATEKGVYFGEITFFPASGYMGFEDERANYLLGSWIRLPIDEN